MTVNQETLQKIEAWVAAHREEIARDIQDFARLRSVSRADLAAEGAPFGPETRAMLDYALARARQYGLKTVDHEGYCGSVCLGDEANAIGIFGHLDVVPEGDKWIYPPYAATREGDFLIGRGVSDNKSACVAAMYVLRLFDELRLPLRHGLRAVFGCAEETGMEDLLYFMKTQPLPAVSLIPDAGFPVNYAQKGTLRGVVSLPLGADILSFTGGEVENMVPPWAECLGRLAGDFAPQGDEKIDVEPTGEGLRLVAHGNAAHAASPEGGVSAIHMLAGALVRAGLEQDQELTRQSGEGFSSAARSGGEGALEVRRADSDTAAGEKTSRAVAGMPGIALKDERSRHAARAICDISGDHYGAQAGIACEDPETGKTTMVIGVARTKEGRVYLNIDCRLSIAADLDAVQANFRAYCDKWGFQIERLVTTKPFYIPKDDPRVEALMAVYQAATGDAKSQPYTMGGGTYSRFLPNALTFGLSFPEGTPKPDLPAYHGGAHGPDEFLYLPDLCRAIPIYASAILALDAIV